MPIRPYSLLGGTVASDFPHVQTRVGTLDNDYIEGGDGADVIYGLEGNDILLGGYGNDRLEGEGGDDLLFGSYGDDTVNGGTGKDELHGGYGNDVINGDAGNDKIYADAGDDQVFGGDGADKLWGHDGNDVLYGGNGSDVLEGGAGNDRMFGGAGADVLNGGPGLNSLWGGAERDLFVIDNRTVPGSTFATIVDFELIGYGLHLQEGDKVDLRALFDQYTNFTGTNADQAWAQGYLYFSDHGGYGYGYNTTVYIDPNGNAPDGLTQPGTTHDFAVVDLIGVAVDQLGAIGQDFYGFSQHFLV